MKYLIIFIIIVLLIHFFLKNTESFVPISVLTNYKDKKETIKLFKKVSKFLKKHNVKYWITGGTLLGAVRNQNMIPWDDDVDISIMDDEVNKLLLLKDELKKKNLLIVKWFGGYKIYPTNGKHIPNKDFLYPFVDVFTTIKQNDKLINKNEKARKIWPKDIYHKTDVEPLTEYEFADYKVYGPNNPYPYLNINYPNWETKAYKDYDHIEHERLKKIYFDIEYNKGKPYLWLYWDTINESKEPAFISLCRKTVYKHCAESFNIVLLNKDNIEKYLPEIKDFKHKLDKLILAHKVDIYRIMLLYKYGGVYLDSDVIVMRNPKEIIEKLKKYDFVGFGCTGPVCKNGYGQPSNWILASQPNSILMGTILKEQLSLLNKINKFDYHDLGKMVIWSCLDKLIKEQNYEYYHYDNTIDGTRDKNGHWITSELVFSDNKIDYDDEDNFMFYVFYNSGMTKEQKALPENELLNKNWNFTKYLKKSLS